MKQKPKRDTWATVVGAVKAATWAAVVALVVLFPGVAVVAGVTYGVLRRGWPDRLVAWLLVALTAPAAVVVLWATDYLGRWATVASAWWGGGRPPAASDWLAIVACGAAVGPIIGAVAWRARQRQREAAPFLGADELDRRQAVEERRARRVVQVVQRTRYGPLPFTAAMVRPLAVPEGGRLGPWLGVYQRGDLGKAWRGGAGRRLVRLPMHDPANRHLVVLGATGMGKTETVFTVAEWAAREGWQVIYVTCKEPANLGKSAAPRFAALADEVGAELRLLTAGVSPFDPMRGSTDDIRDRLIRIEEWGDRYWAHCANLLVGLALDLNAASGRSVDNLPDLVFSLIREELVALAEDSADPRVAQLVAALEDSALKGALMRYASMALHLRGWVAPKHSGGWSFEDADIACIELPTVTRPEAGAALMRLVLRDLGAYLVDDSRRQKTAEGKQRPVLLVIEEVGAVAADPVIGREFVDQVERNRSAGAFSVLTAQDPLGLGDDRAQSALLTNCTVLTYRQTTQAEDIANLAGTERQTEGGADYDATGRYENKGVARRQHTFKLHPQVLKELPQGEFAVINSGRWLKVAAAMSRLGYGVSPSPAVERVTHQVEAGRRAMQVESVPEVQAVAPPQRGQLGGGQAKPATKKGDRDQA